MRKIKHVYLKRIECSRVSILFILEPLNTILGNREKKECLKIIFRTVFMGERVR